MASRSWNLSWPDIIFSQPKELALIQLWFKCFLNFFHCSFLSILVLKAGDIELDLGTNTKSHSYFSCWHWNVNSSPTINHCKVAALNAYKSIYRFDFWSCSYTFPVIILYWFNFTHQLKYVIDCGTSYQKHINQIVLNCISL